MAYEEWTHEMQNVLEALNEGDGSLLSCFKYVYEIHYLQSSIINFMPSF